jgi:predicted phage terminase large subunit-like protein
MPLSRPQKVEHVQRTYAALVKERRRRVAERCRDSFAEFVRESWHVVEPETPLIWNWHIDAVADHLQALYEGRFLKLLINIPPGTAKSIIFAVLWPAWVWTKDPSKTFIFGSYAEKLAIRDSARCRRVISSDWYRDTFEIDWEMRADQNTKGWFENTRGGVRQAIPVGGMGTGFRAWFIGFDDPHNVSIKESPSKRELAEVQNWWDKRMSSRGAEPKTARFAGVMQRIHEDDLSGHIQKKSGWVHLCLPMEYDPERATETPLGKPDPRTKTGELLFPERWGPGEVQSMREDLGDQYPGQANQRPSKPGGNIVKYAYLRFYFTTENEPDPVSVLVNGEVLVCKQVRLPTEFDEIITSWDLTFKAKRTSAFVAGQVWARDRARKFLLDRLLRRLAFEDSCDAIREMAEEWPGCHAHVIEDKANGPAVIETLEDEIPAIEAFDPGSKDKVERLAATTPQWRAGNVYIPHPAECDWSREYMDAIVNFPNTSQKDDVDATSQALEYFRRGAGGWSFV